MEWPISVKYSWKPRLWKLLVQLITILRISEDFILASNCNHVAFWQLEAMWLEVLIHHCGQSTRMALEITVAMSSLMVWSNLTFDFVFIWQMFFHFNIWYCTTGLVKNQKLCANILTPTTKAADHDVPVTPDEVISERFSSMSFITQLLLLLLYGD